MIKLIGISGKAGSGKDYVASLLKPMGYHNYSLAWQLKIQAIATRLVSRDDVFETKSQYARGVLQRLGTEEGRNILGENIWLDYAWEWISLLHNEWNIDKFIIPDIRFPNEVRYIQNKGGVVYRIEAPERIQNSPLTNEQRNHASEIALDGYAQFDGIIYNDPEYMDTTYKQIIQLLSERHNDWIDP